MNNINMIRAWKDAEYRASLSAEELAALPEKSRRFGRIARRRYGHRRWRRYVLHRNMWPSLSDSDTAIQL